MVVLDTDEYIFFSFPGNVSFRVLDFLKGVDEVIRRRRYYVFESRFTTSFTFVTIKKTSSTPLFQGSQSYFVRPPSTSNLSVHFVSVFYFFFFASAKHGSRADCSVSSKSALPILAR